MVFWPDSRVYVETDSNGNVTQTIKDIIDEGKTIFQTPVDTFLEIDIVYPSPSLGWTVQTLDDSKFYRYNGSIWKYIQQIQLSQIDTKLSKLGDTMTGNLNMGGNSIQLGGFTIKHNPDLSSIDFEF